MSYSFVAYIDESGDEGFSFSGPNTSSEWFAISAVVLRRAAETELVRVWREVRQLLRKPHGYTLHFRNLKHEQKVAVVKHIASGRLRTISVVCHKPSLTETEYLREKSALYFYLSRFLFERISWLCRAKHVAGEGDGSTQIVFSNRSSMSYDDIRGYIHRLKEQTPSRDIQIDWDVVRPDQIASVPHKLRDGLQVADAVCSGVWKAFEADSYGNTEHRYAREMAPVAYRHNGRTLGYGVKLWPGDKLASIRSDAAYGWLFS